MFQFSLDITDVRYQVLIEWVSKQIEFVLLLKDKRLFKRFYCTNKKRTFI